MSQNDFVLANASGASFRADANLALQALASSSSGATAPSTTYQYQPWFDTTLNILKIRNGANTAWVNVASLVGSTWKLYEQGTLLLERANTWQGEQTNLNGTRMGLPRGHIDGLTLSNSVADATNDIDVAAGRAASDSDDFDLALTATLTKRLDALWVVGTNQGGLDAGSKAPDTWYHLWLIGRSDTGVVDVLFSTSATAPSLPANYDKKRRIGAVLTDSTAAPNSAIIGFSQDQDEFLWDDPPLDFDANIATTATLIGVSTPAGVKAHAWFRATSLVGALKYFSSPDVNDEAPSTTVAPFYQISVSTTVVQDFWIRTNISSQIRGRSSVTENCKIVTRGWRDPRGRNE